MGKATLAQASEGSTRLGSLTGTGTDRDGRAVFFKPSPTSGNRWRIYLPVNEDRGRGVPYLSVDFGPACTKRGVYRDLLAEMLGSSSERLFPGSAPDTRDADQADRYARAQAHNIRKEWSPSFFSYVFLYDATNGEAMAQFIEPDLAPAAQAAPAREANRPARARPARGRVAQRLAQREREREAERLAEQAGEVEAARALAGPTAAEEMERDIAERRALAERQHREFVEFMERRRQEEADIAGERLRPRVEDITDEDYDEEFYDPLDDLLGSGRMQALSLRDLSAQDLRNFGRAMRRGPQRDRIVHPQRRMAGAGPPLLGRDGRGRFLPKYAVDTSTNDQQRGGFQTGSVFERKMKKLHQLEAALKGEGKAPATELRLGKKFLRKAQKFGDLKL